jgi:hypothetical protein
LDALLEHFRNNPEIIETLLKIAVREELSEVFAQMIDAGQLIHGGFTTDGVSVWVKRR